MLYSLQIVKFAMESKTVTRVEASCSVLSACWSHALTTEAEEVMGLLMGKVEGEVVRLSSLTPIRRITKQKDRVEIDNNSLVAASRRAEELGLQVLGWYHSHPHITVHPSHVDLRTQLNYQALDKSFIGLIFSVFNADPVQSQDTREVVAFQTRETDSGSTCRYIALQAVANMMGQGTEAVPGSVLSALASIPTILMEEELEEYSKAGGGDVLLHNTALVVAALEEQGRLVAGHSLQALRASLELAKQRTGQLTERKQRVMEQLQGLGLSHIANPSLY